MKQSTFETKIKPILLYIGTIGAVITSIAYIILMFVMVIGFKASGEWYDSVVFALINAIVGFVIMQLLKLQGIDFAKLKNESTVKEYYQLTAKQEINKAKAHDLKFFWIRTIISDVIVKALTVAVTTAGLIYIVIEGSQDFNLILLSIVNLLLFACFGLLSLVKAYDFFEDKYVPWLQEKINEYKVKENMAVVEKESNQSRDADIHTDRGANILESSDSDESVSSNSESVVVDYNWSDLSILGRSDNSSDSTTDCTDFRIKETV